MIRVACDIGTTGIHHDQRRTAPGRVLDKGRGDRMIAGGVAADHYDDFSQGRVFHLIGDRARAYTFKQGYHR